MDIHRVNDVNEAVALADDWKRQGTHDWFRGQISNWPLASTVVRLKPEMRDEALQKMGRFENWLGMTPGLEDLAGNTDATIGVAQHYGMPTPFVDFSTEPRVAGFFASYGQPTEGKESCIICLNTADLKDFWRVMPAKYPPPEFLRLHVPNLWRLEAQFGTFLYCLYDKFEHIYDLDRIVFPYTGPVSKPSVEEIYPRRKSNLELLLDQFFMNETLLEGTHRAESIMKNIRTIHVEATDYDPDLIVGDSVPMESSWDATKLKLWLTPTVEQFSTAVTDVTWQFEIEDNVDPAVIGQKIAEDVKRRLDETSGVRSKLVSWTFPENKNRDSSRSGFLLQSLQWLWDSLRTLPYKNEDIAIGIGNCIALYLSRMRIASPRIDLWLDAADSCFGEAVEVEFGAADASYSRAYASHSELLKAVRKDIERFLAPAYRDSFIGNITGLLQAVKVPNRLFDFDRLARVFARQIAPSQVLVRFAGDSKRHSSAIFFSPARLHKFGLP